MTDPYEQYAWIAPLIVQIKAAMNWLRFQLPEFVTINKPFFADIFESTSLRSGFMTGVTCEGVVKDGKLFDYLVMRHNEYINVSEHAINKGLFIPEDLWNDSIKRMTIPQLNDFIDSCVKVEKYENAALAKKELEGRK